MATGADVLSMLIPTGGWLISGDSFDGITFIEAEPITKKEFTDGFAKYDAWKAAEDAKAASKKEAILARLGITEEELKIALG